MVYAYNPNTWEDEEGGSHIQGQSEIHSEILFLGGREDERESKYCALRDHRHHRLADFFLRRQL